MREQEIIGLELKAYTKTLENGLKVLLVPNKKEKTKNKYYMTLGTHFGALNLSFFDEFAKKQVTMPAGIAHFLEHKAFAQENGMDPFTFFSESGCYANAYTNYRATCFVVAGTKDLKENISYFSLKQNGVLCNSCGKLDTSCIQISATTVDAIRYIVMAPPKKIFSFEVPKEAQRELSLVTKLYLNAKLEKEYPLEELF